MNCTKWRNMCNGPRHSGSHSWIWARNMTHANCAFLLEIHSIFAGKGLQTWLAPIEEIHILCFPYRNSRNLTLAKTNKFVYWHSTFGLKILKMARNMARANWNISCISPQPTACMIWIRPRNMTGTKWWILSIVIRHQPIGAEYGLKTQLSPPGEFRVTRYSAYLCWIWVRNMPFANWWNSFIDTRIPHICAEYGFQNNMRLLMKFVNCARHSGYLSRIRARNVTTANRRDSFIINRPTADIWWIWFLNIARISWILLLIVARHLAYLCFLWARNISCTNGWTSCIGTRH